MTDDEKGFAFAASPGFGDWLAASGASIALACREAGRLLSIGADRDGRLSLDARAVPACTAVGAGDDGALWVAARNRLWRFVDILDRGETCRDRDALFVPVVGYTTGALDVHEVHGRRHGPPVLVATRFNCLATPSADASFAPLWLPPFIDGLVAEDRCHLNGVALDRGHPAIASCAAPSNVADGWRSRRRDGGCLVDVASGGIVARGLSMPHSPRLRDGRLWIVQSGAGEFGFVDPVDGRFEAVTALEGFGRGLAFLGRWAVVGVSLPRGAALEDLPLATRVGPRGEKAFCGVAVIDLEAGRVAHRLRFGGVLREINDVALVPGVSRPAAIGPASDELDVVIRIGDA